MSASTIDELRNERQEEQGGLGIKHFGSNEALRGVSFTVRPGEATGYLGPNGAGKSTTMKILTGLLHPTAGEVKAGFTKEEILRKPEADPRAQGGMFERLEGLLRDGATTVSSGQTAASYSPGCPQAALT